MKAISKLLRRIFFLTLILRVSAIPFGSANRNDLNVYPSPGTDGDDGKYRPQTNGNYLPLNGINYQHFRNLKNSYFVPTDILNFLSQINDVENQQNDGDNDDELWNIQKSDKSQYEPPFENYDDKQLKDSLYSDNRIIDSDYGSQIEQDKDIFNVPVSSLKYQNNFSDDRLYNLPQTDAHAQQLLANSNWKAKEVKKRQLQSRSPLQGYISTLKRNALAAFKRQKFKSHQTQFIPSISVEAMTHLGDFFGNLKNNVEFMETGRLSKNEGKLLHGHHPVPHTYDEVKPTGTAAFLHAVRSYRPSQRIRSLVSMTPDGYHGSQFLDPNYMWMGLG